MPFPTAPPSQLASQLGNSLTTHDGRRFPRSDSPKKACTVFAAPPARPHARRRAPPKIPRHAHGMVFLFLFLCMHAFLFSGIAVLPVILSANNRITGGAHHDVLESIYTTPGIELHVNGDVRKMKRKWQAPAQRGGRMLGAGI